jgi:ferredoxin-NADP reductase
MITAEKINSFELSADLIDNFTNADTWVSAGIQWSSGEQKRLVCCRVADETHDVKTFVFRTPDAVPVSFEPGQFITVTTEIKAQSVSRCYTISSSPTRPFTLSITVKRVPGGVMSNWLHDNIKAGDVLQASGPAGTFTPVSHPAEKLLYLSAGSGVTPLMSMSRASIDLGVHRDIVFVHSARTPTDIVFRDELSRMSQVAQGLRVIHVCEDIGSEQEWSGSIGRLTLQLLQQEVPDFMEREVFTCGPPGYMEAIKRLLQSADYPPSRYHQESFDIGANDEDVLKGLTPSSAQGTATYTVRLARSGKTFTMNAQQTVLAAAKNAGAIVPSSCSQGVCGTCKTAVLDGTVQMQHNGGIRQREIDKGMRLLCCSRPTSDLVIDL